MPRIGAEPERRKALIHAAIEMIGEQGSLDVSVKDIAKQAGMSSALAFHYFGDKDEIIIETMRHLLREFSASVVEELGKTSKSEERIDALIRSSFSHEQFDRKTVAAWLVFYLRAYSSPKAARLLGIYTSRLKSNMVDAFKAFIPDAPGTRCGRRSWGADRRHIYPSGPRGFRQRPRDFPLPGICPRHLQYIPSQ